MRSRVDGHRLWGMICFHFSETTMNQLDQILLLCSQELGAQADPTLGDQSRASFAFSACFTSATGISIKLQKGARSALRRPGGRRAWIALDRGA